MNIVSEGSGYVIVITGNGYANRSAEWNWNLRAGDIARGFEFGYPPCCIRFFVTTWHRWWSRGLTHLIRRHNARSNQVGYVQCPKCQRKGKSGRVPHFPVDTAALAGR